MSQEDEPYITQFQRDVASVASTVLKSTGLDEIPPPIPLWMNTNTRMESIRQAMETDAKVFEREKRGITRIGNERPIREDD